MLLEGYECEETAFERPTLLRESFTLKHYMYATEKVVVKKNMNSLPYNQPMHKLRDMIEGMIAGVNSKVTSELQVCVLGLMNKENHETLAEAIVSYQIRQFMTMCEAFKLKLQSIKDSLIDQSSYPFLQAVMQIQRDAKVLYKKMLLNKALMTCFREILVAAGHFDSTVNPMEIEILMINILGQLFAQRVVMHHLPSILECFEHELTLIRPQNIEVFIDKRVTLHRVLSYLNAFEDNQETKVYFANLINPQYQGFVPMKNANDIKMRATYKRYVRECHNLSKTKAEFL